MVFSLCFRVAYLKNDIDFSWVFAHIYSFNIGAPMHIECAPVMDLCPPLMCTQHPTIHETKAKKGFMTMGGQILIEKHYCSLP